MAAKKRKEIDINELGEKFSNAYNLLREGKGNTSEKMRALGDVKNIIKIIKENNINFLIDHEDVYKKTSELLSKVMIDDKDKFAREGAAKVLEKSFEDKNASEICRQAEFLRDGQDVSDHLGKIKDERAAKVLIENMKHPDFRNNLDFVNNDSLKRALEKIGDQAVPAIIEALKTENEEQFRNKYYTKVDLIEVLGKIGGKSEIEKLLDQYEEAKSRKFYPFGGPTIEDSIVSSLETMNERGVLVNIATSKNKEMKENVIEALKLIGNDETLMGLAKLKKRTDDQEVVKRIDELVGIVVKNMKLEKLEKFAKKNPAVYKEFKEIFDKQLELKKLKF